MNSYRECPTDLCLRGSWVSLFHLRSTGSTSSGAWLPTLPPAFLPTKSMDLQGLVLESPPHTGSLMSMSGSGSSLNASDCPLPRAFPWRRAVSLYPEIRLSVTMQLAGAASAT